MRTYHEHIFDDIAKIVTDNLIILYNYNDNALINIRNYCQNHAHKRYKPLDYFTLICFLEEALAEIINCNFLYDFRDIE